MLGKINLRLFDTQTTQSTGLTAEMKTFYSDYLLDIATTNLVHDQFGQKKPIPKNGGKTIEFRKYSPLAKATTPITEGVTPAGNSLNVSTITATVAQYGDWIGLSDVLILTAIDNNIVEATKLLGDQAGRTLDTVTREVLNGGTNVMYAPIVTSAGTTEVTSRASLTKDAKLTVDIVMRAATKLRTMHAVPIDGSFVAIVHPNTAYDLKSDPRWIEAHKYAAVENLFNGEIGKIDNVRFVEATEAKIFAAAGANKESVYSTLVLGENAYGITEVEGGGLKHIVKPLGSGGTSDPLDQRASVGWKAIKTAERLVEEFMIRIESSGTFSAQAAN